MTIPAATAVGENSNVAQRYFTLINSGTANDCTVSSASNIITNVQTASMSATTTPDITFLSASLTNNAITVDNSNLGVTVDSGGYSHSVATTVAQNTFAVASAFTDGSTISNVYTGASTAATVTDVTSSVATTVAGSVANTYSGALSATSTVTSSGSITAAITGLVTATIAGDVTMGGSVTAATTGTVTLAAGTSRTSATSVILKPGASIVVIADGTSWYQIGGSYTGN
eukprot:CAMPEP_0172608702 /NCGR_PEP_ID=MMETSP1068-20121228/28767_1 /TAXON_ID=35684 /ORGANISM="Pseudopedinella elastica, Strain CCMP716" /LENGTH=228 /DNA_ID=CAMNT_0013412033 /DNA_START=485 /DNA_END=1171 /DNA_ORIENTATION=+